MGNAAVVGSGPNGLAAAVVLARAGLRVDVYEETNQVGGGVQTRELTLPGYRHDVGAAVHPMAFASRFFREFDIRSRVDFALPEISYAHPLDEGGVLAYHDLERTVDELGPAGRAWRSLLRPLVRHIDEIADISSDSMIRIPTDPVNMLRLGTRVLTQGTAAGNYRLRDDRTRALLSGVEAHAVGKLPGIATAAVGLVLAAHAHAGGWPVPRGGSSAIIDAMRADVERHGGRIHLEHRIDHMDQLGSPDVTIFDVSARSLASIARDRLPDRYRSALLRFRYGDAVAKVDFALAEPIPWKDARLRDAVTLHLGGTRREIAAAEREVASGHHAERPYVLLTQPTVIDPTRAPEGRHVAWAYIHVPKRSTVDPLDTIVRQIERWAPGFRDTVLASHSMTADDIAHMDSNFVGGDISSGQLTLRQLIARPTFSPVPWRTPLRGVYLGSSSTTPGTGVHGMAGFHAAKHALRDIFASDVPSLTPQPHETDNA